MRGLVGSVVVALIVLAIAAAAILPIALRPLVVDAVRAALPFGEQAYEIDADVSAIGVIRGTIDRIHVAGARLEVVDDRLGTTGIRVGALDLAATDVGIGDHAFRSITGTIASIDVPAPDGTAITIDSIDVSGAAPVVAVVHLGFRAGLALVGAAFADAGVPVDVLELVDGGVVLGLFDQRVEVAIAAADGGLELVDVAGTGPLVLVAPRPGDPWRITAASTTPAGVVVTAELDVSTVLR